MQDHYEKVGQRFSPTPSFFENEAANEAFMYLSYWYAGLYVVCEGWQKLKLVDREIDALLKSPHMDVLKRFRHGVYHYQADYFDLRFMNAFTLGKDFDDCITSLAHAFNSYLDAWAKSQAVDLTPAQL